MIHIQAPRTPAQLFALVIGGILLAFGVVALVLGHTDFGAGSSLGGSQFILWMTNGWDTIIWMALGALGLLAAAQSDTARTYSLLAGVFFALVAVWGFIDGDDAFGLMAVDTTDNITHAVIAALGFTAAMAPAPASQTGSYGGGHPTHA